MSDNTKRWSVAVPYTRLRSHAFMVWLDPETKGYFWKVWRIKPGPKREVAKQLARPALTANAAAADARQAIEHDRSH